MSRKVVLYEEVSCDLCGVDDDPDIKNLIWSWNGIEYEVDLCSDDRSGLELGRTQFSKMLKVSRTRKFPCTKCDQQFDTEARMKQHRTRKHGKETK